MKRLATGVLVSTAVVHLAIYGWYVAAAYACRTWSEWLEDAAVSLEDGAAVCAPYEVSQEEAA